MKLLVASHACALPQNQQLFALAAKQRGYRFTMVLPQEWKAEYGNRLKAQLYQGFDADLVPSPVINNGSVPLHAYCMRIRSLIKQVKPDLIYAHNEAYGLSTLQWCRAAKATGVPFGFFSCQNLAKKYPVPFRQAESWVYRNSRFFFPITGAVDDVHRQKGYEGPSTILPLGFDPDRYHPTVDVNARHRQAADREFRLAFVGRVVEEKGLETLANALGKLKDLSWKLIMIGSGPHESRVRSALENNGVAARVQWRGFVPHDEVARFFESVDCLVLPSETRKNWKEQFGRVLVESMACGTPVIGSDSGEIPNIIRATGGGLVFHESQSDSLAGRLRKMMTDIDARCAMADSGLAYVREHYALPKLATRFCEAIESAN